MASYKGKSWFRWQEKNCPVRARGCAQRSLWRNSVATCILTLSLRMWCFVRAYSSGDGCLWGNCSWMCLWGCLWVVCMHACSNEEQKECNRENVVKTRSRTSVWCRSTASYILALCLRMWWLLFPCQNMTVFCVSRTMYILRSAYSCPCMCSTPDPAKDEHVHTLQQLLKEREKDRIRKREREGEHKYAGAQHACASEIEMNRKSSKERGQDDERERRSFFVRVRVSIYLHARAHSLKHTHTHIILHAVSCPDSHFSFHIKLLFCIVQTTNHYF